MVKSQIAKHSDGPWMLEGDAKIGYRIKIGPPHEIRDIVIVGRVWDRTAQAEDLANARLIKASPALLAACKGLLELIIKTKLFESPAASDALRAVAMAEDDTQPANPLRPPKIVKGMSNAPLAG